MEQRELFQIKFKSFIKALQGFEDTLNIDLFGFEEKIQDAVKNGRIQKMNSNVGVRCIITPTLVNNEFFTISLFY
jgi:hypothetical protein